MRTWTPSWLQVLGTAARARLWPAALAGLAAVTLAAPGRADPRAPVTVVPAPGDRGPIFNAGIRSVDELPRPYHESEHFVSGAADVFAYGTPPVRGARILREAAKPYTTRIIVRRPANPRRFRGTVVVEWFNSTAGFDSAPAWDLSADHFARRGIVYVGVTVSPVSVAFLAGGCAFPFSPPCGDRYAALSLPEPGQAYEMVSQIVTLLRGDAAGRPLPRHYRVRRVLHVGQSQQAADLTTYAREFHFDGNDGYFLQAGLGFGKPLSTGSPDFPPGHPDRVAPTDLPVPVVRAQTETDLALFVLPGGTRQTGADNDLFRYYEIAGMAHNIVHETEILPAGVAGPDPVRLGDLCVDPPNTSGDGPVFGKYVYNAIWHNLERQARFGRPMPLAEPVLVENGAIVRDVFGNAVGGIRLPALDVPLATYTPDNRAKPACGAPGSPPPPDCLPAGVPPIIGLACLLTGGAIPFERDLLDALYPRRSDYLLPVLRHTVRLRHEGFLLGPGAKEIRERARAVDVGRRLPWWRVQGPGPWRRGGD